ncbi:MAG TPA: methylmalonyl Co-A mutase-associated GTPase MeaB [Chitinophagales bacterium]|nr:methylmalonyl Co-A mutase-associated GTPase MeaB [Chitinophagales bacterium]
MHTTGFTGALELLDRRDHAALARLITLVENEHADSHLILSRLNINSTVPVIGLTGPPGAGKSSLLDGLVEKLLQQNKRIGVVAVDPSSPFNFGALLGDRIRLGKHFNSENVFIRSMATRGSLGGLADKVPEVIDVMRHFNFDFIFVETVGVGQSEVEIAGLADTTVVVLVPEGGDDVQAMKAGLMEIADVFVVNKADDPNAGEFAATLGKTLAVNERTIPVIKTTATTGDGLDELLQTLLSHQAVSNPGRVHLLAQKAMRLIYKQRTRDIHPQKFFKQLTEASHQPGFNLYNWVKQF